jgi:demethylmenaquinone methyltransferase/2-methoxy-6-polyprenyl-1,4-benzoquinol methylase
MTEDYYPYIKGFFKKWARIYDIIVFLLVGVRGKVVDITGAKAGAEVLDIATGTGKQAFAFARRGYHVIGIDLSEDMLRIAKKNNKYKNVHFLIGDASGLPFEDNLFDVTCISFALHDMPLNIGEKALQEMVRVTRPQGSLVIVDYSLPRNRIGKYLAYNIIKLYESKYYPEFIKADLREEARKSGIKLEEERPVLFGAARIIRGRVDKIQNLE